jgi:hypothetical protein
MTSTNAYAHGHTDRFVTATGGLHSDELAAPETLEPGALDGISGGTAHTPPEPPPAPTGCIIDGSQPFPFPRPDGLPKPLPLPLPRPEPTIPLGPFHPSPKPVV